MKKAVSPILAAFSIVLAAFSTGLGGTALAATPLVDAAWVKANIADDDVVFLDVRGSPRAFESAHIPGAVLTHYGRDGWRVARDGVPGMLPETSALEKLIGGLGIGNDSHVVIAANGTSATEMGVATRIYWTFKVLGHDEVSILDGGMRVYLADSGNPVSTGPVTPRARTFKAAPRPELLATADDVRKAVEDGGAALIDHRPRSQFIGESKSPVAARFGTIPGSSNAPAVFMTEDGGGVFKAGDALKALYEMGGANTGGPVINYCNTGHWASVGWFVSYELLGNKQAKMYDGSVAEWSADARNPMERRAGLK